MYKKLILCLFFACTTTPINTTTTLHEELRESVHNFKRATSHIIDFTLSGMSAGSLCLALYHILSNSENSKKCNESITLTIGCLGLLFIKKNWNPEKEVHKQNKWFNAGLAQLMSAWGWGLLQPIRLHTNQEIPVDQYTFR